MNDDQQYISEYPARKVTRKTFRLAFANSLPIMFAYLVVGFTFGIMMYENGFRWYHSMLSAMTIYSGSLQIAMVPMIAARTPLPVMAVASFLINSRYMFYGIGFTQRFRKQGLLYPYMIIAFPDEVYGVFSGKPYPKDVDPVRCDRWTAFMCHGAWISGGVLGTLFGNVLPFDLTGIDFAATAMFVCIVIEQWMSFTSHLPLLVGIVSGLLCLFILGPDNFILPSLILSLILLLILKSRIEPASASAETTSTAGAASGQEGGKA